MSAGNLPALRRADPCLGLSTNLVRTTSAKFRSCYAKIRSERRNSLICQLSLLVYRTTSYPEIGDLRISILAFNLSSAVSHGARICPKQFIYGFDVVLRQRALIGLERGLKLRQNLWIVYRQH